MQLTTSSIEISSFPGYKLETDAAQFINWNAIYYNVTAGTLEDTYYSSKSGNSYSLIESYQITGTGIRTAPYETSATATFTASGQRVHSWNDYNYVPTSIQTTVELSGYDLNSTQLADDIVSYTYSGPQRVCLMATYQVNVAITQNNSGDVHFTFADNHTQSGTYPLMSYVEGSGSMPGPYQRTTSRIIAPGHLATVTSSVTMKTYEVSSSVSEDIRSESYYYGHWTNTYTSSSEVSEVITNGYATSSITSTLYTSGRATTSTTLFYTYSHRSETATSYSYSLRPVALTVSTSSKVSYTYVDSTFVSTEYGYNNIVTETRVSTSVSSTLNTDGFDPQWQMTSTYQMFEEQDMGDRSMSMTANVGLIYNHSDDKLTISNPTHYTVSEYNYSDNTFGSYTMDFLAGTEGTVSLTGTSSSVLSTGTQSNLLGRTWEGIYGTDTVASQTFYYPEKTINGIWETLNWGTTITGNWPFYQSYYTVESQSATNSNLHDNITGALTVVEEATSTVTYTLDPGAPGGYIFSNTIYTSGSSATSFESYFEILDTGLRNYLYLTNGVYVTSVTSTIEDMTSGNFTGTWYNVTLSAPNSTDMYAHFDTESSVIRYTSTAVSSDTLYHYESDATFWYVKPDMALTYTRQVYMETGYYYSNSWNTYPSMYTSSMDTVGATGIVLADENLCVLYTNQPYTSWTESYNTETILTSMETNTIPDVIGGISNTSVTTVSNTFPFGSYSQYGTYTKSDTTYTKYSARMWDRARDFISSYTFYTERTIDQGISTTWYSTLTSAVWDIVTTLTSSTYTFTWEYTTKNHWWINETQSIGLGTASTSTTVRGSTTTTGNQIINNYSSETYQNSYTTAYTGKSDYGKNLYTESILQIETFFSNYTYDDPIYLSTGITADLPLIYQSESATATIAQENASYSINSNGKTNYIQRSVSVIVTSSSPIEYSYRSRSATEILSDFDTVPISSTKTTSFQLTSHVEAYSVIDSQGWFTAGFKTLGNENYVPVFTHISEITNISSVQKNTYYNWYTYSREASYDSSSYTIYDNDVSSLNYDVYYFSPNMHIDMIFDATAFTSYDEIDLINGRFNTEAKLLVGTSYSAETDVWTVNHYSEIQSEHYYYDTAESKYKRTTTLVSGPDFVESFTWSNPAIYNAETYYIIDSVVESQSVMTNRYGTTIIDGTFYTVTSSDSQTRTFAHGTSYETQLVEMEDKLYDNTISGITSSTFLSVKTAEPVYNTTSTVYDSWSGITYTANEISVFNAQTTMYTMNIETSFLYTGYQFTSTLDTYYITSIYGQGYTLDKHGSYTTVGYTQSGLETTNQYYLSARQGYTTIGETFGSYTSTANEKVVSVVSSSIGNMTVTYYDTEYSQTVQAIAAIRDYYTTYYTTSVFGVDKVTRTPEYITAIVTNTTSFTGIPGTINYESTYLSGTVTLTKGVGY